MKMWYMYVWRIYDTLVDQKERFGVWYMLPFLHGTICKSYLCNRSTQNHKADYFTDMIFPVMQT